MPQPPRLTVSLTMPRLKGIIRLVKTDELYAEPLRRSMEEVGRYGYSQAVVNAPVLSGRTVARMRYRVQQKPVPLWTSVKTTAVNPRSKYPYPRRLNYDPKSPHRGWFDRAIDATQRIWPGLLERAAREIAARWTRGSR